MAEFPLPAADFYRDLRVSNTREFWLQNKERYDTQVREPLTRVVAMLKEAFAGGGFYRAEPDALARLRAAIDDERSGTQLQGLVDGYRDDGWLITGDSLRTSPRGFTKDHPRIELLRYRSLSAMREVTATGEEAFAEQVRGIWRGAAPLVDWLARRLND